MKNTKRSFLYSVISMLLCVTMLMGTTYAWFTDNANSSKNIITSGNLDIEMYWTDDLTSGEWNNAEDDSAGAVFAYDNWEPGYTEVRYIKIVNAGSLAFRYRMTIDPEGVIGKLAEVIDVYYIENTTENLKGREALANLNPVSTLVGVIEGNLSSDGVLLPKEAESPLYTSGETIIAVAMKMQEDAGNEYQNESIGDGFSINLLAAQFNWESDSFGDKYDENATFPELELPAEMSATVTPTADGKVPAGGVTMQNKDGSVKVTVPSGAKLKPGVKKLTATVKELEESDANIVLGDNEILRSLDVHVEGLDENNTVPALITIEKALMTGLNLGNYQLYHVENGASVPMVLVSGTPNAHNEFTYDPATGDVTLAMATFSEVAAVADTVKAWEGNYDYSWYVAKNDEYTIANADQLAAFGAIVGGMDNQTRDSFKEKTVKLLSDINLGDKESYNNSDLIFYPIGYYNDTGSYEKVSGGSVTSNVNSFEGTFDGNGHTISNFYQNTWEMFGGYNDGYTGTPNHYNDAMGLFGYVVNGTIQNLTVNNFSSDGEFTPTGVIAAYAVNSTFENIAITKCNPRVYNTGNGGIVGIGGNSDDSDAYKLTFTNITIDNSNKITALWGSWDVACGGLVGMFRGAGHAYMTNCHVAAQIDVYNDVCGNYQYYWYRYSGMMIGTNKNMITDENGYTVPETSKFHAEDCTVHFGEWNDYYYCELVANSLASYTHDHQFSRLEQISSLDEIKNGDAWKKAGNFLLISGDTKTCYHIVEKDGVLQQHLHTDAGEETVNGETVLKEDKQIVYLPFNQLFTGYGWGVKHIPVYNGEDYAFEGITILDRKVANSVVKFEGKKKTKVPSEVEINIGDIFSFNNSDVKLVCGALTVTVTNLDEDNPVSAEFVRNIDNWAEGKLKLTGKGQVAITIQDYYFCTPTTISVSVVDDSEIEKTEKFETKFTGDFLYRVGDKNPVNLGLLFSAENEVGNVKVDVESVDGNTSGTYTPNKIWTNGTVQFNGNGVVKVIISDDDYYCIPTILYLEVINATNVTKYNELKNQNSVLLNDITMLKNSAFYLSNATLHGNGFEFNCQDAAYSGTNSVSENYIIGLTNAHLDNVKIVGKVYTEYGAQASDDYNRALVVSKGNSTITNCYLSNTASPVRLVEGSLTIKGSTVKGGNFANIDVRNGHLVLENVTTINQAQGNDKADDASTVIGLGVVIYYENVDTTLTSIKIKGDLTQYNHISSNEEFSNSYANTFANEVFKDTYSDLQYVASEEVKWINAGIIAMTEDVVITDSRTDKKGYSFTDVVFMGNMGTVYTSKPTDTTIQDYPENYKTKGQGVIAPSYSFDYTNKNYIAKTDGSNDYCYYDNGKVLISMDQGNAFNWDPFILTVSKYGEILSYIVSMNGTTYSSGSKISFNTAGDYAITYTYTDPNNYKLDVNGNPSFSNVEYTQTVTINVSVIKPTTQHATFTFADTNTATEKITVNDKTYISATGVSATDKEWGYITINGSKVFYPITEAQMQKDFLGTEVQVYYYVFKDAVTITDYKDGGTGGEQKYDSSTTTKPSNLSVVNGMEAKYTDINSACVDISKLTKDGPSGEVWDFSASTTVSETTKYNNYLAHSSPSGLSIKSGTRDYDAITVAQFSYTDAAGATYYYFVGYFMPNQVSSEGGSGCVTPDTLVTLADGTQVRVDSLTGNEELLVWNMETGKLDKAPIMFVDSDPRATFEVIKLYFSDGTEVKVIYEHGFWDYDLNKYVYLDANAADYIGHTFAMQNGDKLTKVTLVNVVIETEETTAWSPVTEGHLCYFVNGMLSMPGGVGGLFNIFDVNAETMTYDYAAMASDIATYGLFTYEELNAIAPLSEEMFHMAGGAYLKISIGKGNLTMDELINMINRYSIYFN